MRAPKYYSKMNTVQIILFLFIYLYNYCTSLKIEYYRTKQN